MRSLVKVTTVIVAACMILSAESSSEAQEAVPTSPELVPLQRFIGFWDWNVVIKRSEWAPDNTKMTGDVTVKPMLGKRNSDRYILCGKLGRVGCERSVRELLAAFSRRA